MELFTKDEFVEKFTQYASIELPNWYIEASSEMIFSQIGLRYRDNSWDNTTVPLPIKNACMEQMRFMLEHDLPLIDSKKITAGNMSAEIQTDYSTLALRILANNGYLYRGNRMNDNMMMTLPWG